jgi:hypothetical protein
VDLGHKDREQRLVRIATAKAQQPSAPYTECFAGNRMPEMMQKAGLLTINAWAIDGFTKVFWRDEPLSHLWPQVLVLVAVGAVLFAIPRRAARRWEIV